VYESSLNPLGMPPHIAQDPHRRFGLDAVTDHSMALLEQTQEEYRSGTGKPQHGLRLIVTEGVPLPQATPPDTV
jgi:hypothetical protein